MLHLRSILALSALGAFTTFAQTVTGPPPPGEMFAFQRGGGGPGGGFVFGEAKIMAESGFDGKVVKGAPYSAQAVTETTQMLANGTRISRKNSTSLARDSEGRTRREENLSSVGPWSTDGQSHTMVFINDPVAQNNYVLDPSQRSANKMASHRAMVRRTVASDSGATTDATRAKLKAEMATMANRHQKELANTKTESLGTQTISGVVAEGTRRTRTIPAGQIGNDQPINIVSETWYSQDLQMVVMSKHSDPRNGDTTYTVTNLQRSEPDASLFAVPADFTVQDNSQPHTMIHRSNQ